MDADLKELILHTADYMYHSYENGERSLMAFEAHLPTCEKEMTHLVILLSDAFNEEHTGLENELASCTLRLLCNSYMYAKTMITEDNGDNAYTLPLCKDLSMLIRSFVAAVDPGARRTLDARVTRVFHAKSMIKQIDDMRRGLGLIFLDAMKEKPENMPDLIAIRLALEETIINLRKTATEIVKFES